MTDTLPRPRISDAALGLVVFALALAPVAWLYLVSWPGDQWQVDLEVYRDAGVSVLHGRPVYEHLTEPPQLLPFTYTPFGALVAVPLALVPFAALGWIWTVLQAAATGATVAYAAAPLLRRVSRPWLVWGLLAGPMLWLHPVGDGIRFGQVNAFLILMCLLDLRPQRPRWLARIPRGALIGLAMAIKLTPGIFVLYLLYARRWREAAGAVGAAAVASIVAAVALPTSTGDFWFGALLDPTRLGFNAGTANQSLRGWLLRSGPTGVWGQVLWLALAALVVWVGFRAARRLAASGDWVGQVATVGFVGVLVSPVSWIHHHHWAVVAICALANVPAYRRAWPALVVAAWYWCRMPWWGVTWLLTTDWPRFGGELLKNGDVIGAALVLALLVRRSRGAPDPVGARDSRLA